MSINKRVIDLSVGKHSHTGHSEKQTSVRNSRVLHLHTESRVNEISVIPGRNLWIFGENRSSSQKARKSKSKGISLVSPSSSTKKYKPQELSSKKIRVLQKKIS